ncbi:MAG: hypothetical protein LBS65_10770 [Desulfovibrio sp.]|nr:hypothetical protein [Desulfovibrio sp.]
MSQFDTATAVSETEARAETRISVVNYSAEEVIRQFLALYLSLNFEEELSFIGVGRLSFFRRRKCIREFNALAIALWELALQKSFPDQAAEFFAALREDARFVGSGREAEKLVARVDAYAELLKLRKDADFLPVAEHMAGLLSRSARDFARLRLKLSLSIRSLYTLIFDKLV